MHLNMRTLHRRNYQDDGQDRRGDGSTNGCIRSRANGVRYVQSAAEGHDNRSYAPDSQERREERRLFR